MHTLLHDLEKHVIRPTTIYASKQTKKRTEKKVTSERQYLLFD